MRRIDGHGEGGRMSVEFGPEVRVCGADLVAGQQVPPDGFPVSSPVFPDIWGLGGLDGPGAKLGSPKVTRTQT
jgi:hypothetical protein